MRYVIILIFFFNTLFSFGQRAKPKLVVGIVVDQMRYDYLEKYWDKFGEDGFKKLVNNGFNSKNTHYNYMPTFTAPGHASIFSGTTPKSHGIIANEWYDKKSKEMVYCTDDSDYKTVGSNSDKGKMSPNRMLGGNLSDELKIITNSKAKAIGISLKDRGAILSIGKKADAAYWFEGGNTGKWISSSYYMDELPDWVRKVNKKNTANTLLNSVWNTFLPIEDYTESIADDNPYETLFEGETKPVFPHDLQKLRQNNNNFSLIKSTPFGNTITTEIVIAAITSEGLGQDEITDFLAISYSSTDYVGHQFGPASLELEDTYLRLDQSIAELISFLESEIGKDNILIVLTSDHGVADVPQYTIDKNLSAGYFDEEKTMKALSAFLTKKWKTDDLIENVSNFQLFLNHKNIKKNKLKAKEIERDIVEFLSKEKDIEKVYSYRDISKRKAENTMLGNLERGYKKKRSGDVLFVLKPGFISSYYKTGTTHGSPYPYDTHVPLIWYGYNIPKGETTDKVTIPDIAATLADLLGIVPHKTFTGKSIFPDLAR